MGRALSSELVGLERSRGVCLFVCSHTEFAAIFLQLSTSVKNKLLNVVSIKGTLIEQIKQVWEEADTHYTSLHLADKWNVPGGSAHYGEENEVAPWIKCDNCGENHSLTDCPKTCDESCIKAKRDARNASSGNKGNGHQKKSGDGGGNGGNCRGTYN